MSRPRSAGETGASLRSEAELARAERRRRRAQLLADLAEARELRARVAPRRARLEKTREALRRRLFRL